MADSRQRGNKVRVAVIFGGRSAEHDVSLRSAQTVMNALDPDRYEVLPIGVTREGRWLSGGDPHAQLASSSPLFALGDGGGGAVDFDPNVPVVAEDPAGLPQGLSGEIDVVFPVLHGPMGEDGTVQGLLELAGMPFVGSGVLGSALGMDKAMAKTVFGQAGLPQGPWRLVTRKEWERDPDSVAEFLGETFGFPLFVKPANMGSSVGVGKAHTAAELPDVMELACRFDRRLVVEGAIDAREIEVAVLGNDEPVASVAGEIVPDDEFYSYAAKYISDGSKLLIPAPLDPDAMIDAQELAIAAFRALDLAGMARVDFFLDRNTDQMLINEVNTIPGFTAISMYPLLWEASGVPLPELVDRLIQLALERHAERGG
jgi:D-alanine-D-alanine ligase